MFVGRRSLTSSGVSNAFLPFLFAFLRGGLCVLSFVSSSASNLFSDDSWSLDCSVFMGAPFRWSLITWLLPGPSSVAVDSIPFRAEDFGNVISFSGNDCSCCASHRDRWYSASVITIPSLWTSERGAVWSLRFQYLGRLTQRDLLFLSTDNTGLSPSSVPGDLVDTVGVVDIQRALRSVAIRGRSPARPAFLTDRSTDLYRSMVMGLGARLAKFGVEWAMVTVV